MQITIYLPEEVIKRVDILARKEDKSRSAVVQEILAEGLRKRSEGTPTAELLSSFGSWRMSQREVNQIRRVRGKDIRKARFQP